MGDEEEEEVVVVVEEEEEWVDEEWADEEEEGRSGLTRRRVVQRETLKIVELTLKVRGELTRVKRSKILRVRVGLEQRVFACYNLGPDGLQQIQVTA